MTAVDHAPDRCLPPPGPPPGPARAGQREWIGLAVLALPCLLYSMDLTVLHLAVPQISAALKPSGAQLLWIIDIYGFLVAGSLITMGALGDRYGRRKLLLTGAAFFGAASVLAAFAASAGMLIATRALLGIAGATLAPSTLSLIRNMFLDARQRTAAVAVWITCFSVGGAIGPVIGGVVLEYFWWGAVFLIGVPVMLLLLIVGPILLPEYRDPAAGRPDVASAVLSLAAVLAVIFGLKQLAQEGPGWLPALSVLAGAAAGVAFVRRQQALVDPLIDLRLFRELAFSASLATYALGIFVMFGAFLFLPQYLQLVLELSPLEAGLWMVPWALAFVAGSTLTPWLVRHVRPAYIMAAGLLVAAAGFALFVRLDAASGLAYFVVGSVVFSLGLAPLFTLTTDLVVGAAPPQRAGAAAAISETGAELAGALGIAIFGTAGIAVYRSTIAGLLPPDVPPDAAAAAADTLGGAVAAAARLPGATGATVVGAARAAFLEGLRLTAAVSAVGAVLVAVLAGTLLRDARPGAEPQPGAEP